jgi:type IV pilus assembly protein PilC
MRLRYKAATKDGKVTTGLLEAKDISSAASYLRSKELLPISITEVENKLTSYIPFLNRVKTQDLIIFTRQMSSMLSSGLTLLRALEILKDQVESAAMSEVVNSLINDVSEGRTFAQAMEKHPRVFSPIYVSIIQAGESSGLLDKVLLRLADNLEKEAKLKATIKSALMYPVIVIVLMIVVMIVMMVFVIPQLTVLYTNLNIELPLPTQILLAASQGFAILWPVILVGVILGVIGYRKWAATVGGRLIVDNLILRSPIFGELIRKTILAEFSRTFGLLVGTGTLVVEALNETANIAGNVHYKNAILAVGNQVEKGVSVGQSMSYSPLFPPILVQLVKIGEQTGKMDENLQKASEYFEREVDQTVKTLTTAMEPFIMVVLGIGVAFLIISVITPIYSLISSIQ